MKNPYPITRARRLEARRKEMGYAQCCFYCGETDPDCFELDHPATKKLDLQFKRTVCCKCHRKLERNRDNKNLTKNGLRNVIESEREKERRYHLLLAEDLDSIADVVQSLEASPEMIAAALREAASSLRRTAPALQSSELPNDSIATGVPGSTDTKCA